MQILISVVYVAGQWPKCDPLTTVVQPNLAELPSKPETLEILGLPEPVAMAGMPVMCSAYPGGGDEQNSCDANGFLVGSASMGSCNQEVCISMSYLAEFPDSVYIAMALDFPARVFKARVRKRPALVVEPNFCCAGCSLHAGRSYITSTPYT